MHVEMYSLIRQISGERTLEVSALNVKEALQCLQERYGEEFQSKVYHPQRGLADGVNIILKGKNIQVLQGLDTPLEETDTLALFYSIEGG